MSDSKKLKADISKEVLRNISSNLNIEYSKKEESMNDSIILYMEDDFSIDFIETMKNGYIEMSDINLEISELGFEQDVCDFIEYESRL